MNGLKTIDFIVFLVYFIIVASYGYWIYNRKKKASMDSHDFFLSHHDLTQMLYDFRLATRRGSHYYCPLAL